MAGESFLSIELALGAAVFVLGLRLIALVRAGRTLPDAEARVQEALKAQDGKRLNRELRRLGQGLPFEAISGELLKAAENPSERGAALNRAAAWIERRVARRTSQGQALDLVALGVALGLAVFAQKALPTTQVFWSLGGILFALLAATVVARGTLKFGVLNAVKRITTILAARPTLPTLSGERPRCPWCHASVRVEDAVVEYEATDLEADHTSILLCNACGKGVFRSHQKAN